MEELMTVYKRACESALQGNYADALNDFIWLHDNPTIGVPSTESVRRAYGFLAWAALANKYPPALARMQEILDLKRIHAGAHPQDAHAAADIRAMEHALKTMGQTDQD